MASVSNSNPFGRTLALVNGDLQLVADGGFAMVTGRDDLLQGLNTMIYTPFGSDIFNVNYGFDILNAIASPLPPQAIQDVIRLNIVKSVTVDNRIREVKEVVFDDDPHFYDLSPQSDPTDRSNARRTLRNWQAIVVLRTVSDTDVTISLQGSGL
jgi:hypothetical protein